MSYNPRNEQFLEYLDTYKLNEQMNKYLTQDISLMLACTWLKNIRNVSDRKSRQCEENADSTKAMPIIDNYKTYGIPEIPYNSNGSIRKLRLFIVGCGARANGYLTALLQDYVIGEAPYVIVGVADPIKSRRKDIITMAQLAKIDGCDSIVEFDTWENVQPNEFHIDVAMIMTMDRDHSDPAVYFMKNGCHVIVEKPLDGSIEKIQAMVDAMYEYKRFASVCTVLEYTSHARKMKYLIQHLGTVEDLLIREQVGVFHDSYAYGTGPFCNSFKTSPYAIAKTIHDLSMGLCLTESAIKSLIYMPSESMASRGKYGTIRKPENHIYDPHVYLSGFIHKLIYQMKAGEVLDESEVELDLSSVSKYIDHPDTYTMQQIIEALIKKDNSGSYVINIPENEDEMVMMNDNVIQRLADLYRPFHIYLARTNYWFNTMMYKANNCDQPAGFTILVNLESGAQFKMICSIQSSIVCVRHYQIRCEGGEIISDCPEIKCTKFGVPNVKLSDNECYVPDESKISKRGMHGGADAMFAHTVLRKMGTGIVTVEQMTRDGESDDTINNYILSHELNVHFVRNAILTNAILKAVDKPNTLITV